MPKSGSRTEGWGSVVNAAAAHYFGPDGRSLCGRWAAWGAPRWETQQKRGAEPKRGDATCKACWKKAPEVAP